MSMTTTRRILTFAFLLLASPALVDACVLKQSTAVSLKLGPFVDTAGAATTGLTISQADVRVAKNDGAWAQKNESTSCTHEENGMYECPFDTTDTNTVGIINIVVAEAGALIERRTCMVLAAASYDAHVPSTGLGMPADVKAWLGTAAATPTTAGVPEVDVTFLAGTSQTAGGDAGLAAARFLGMIELDGAVYRYTANAIELAPASGGALTMTESVWKHAAPNIVEEIFIRDSVTGLGKTGIAFDTANLVIAWARLDQGDADAATCTPADMTRGTYVSCGIVEKDPTVFPGWYYVGLPAAVIATGADAAALTVRGTAGTFPTIKPILLVGSTVSDVATLLGTPGGANHAADNAAIKAVVDLIKVKTDPIATIGGLVQARVDGHDTGLSPTDALVALHLDHLLAATYDPASKPGAADSLFNIIFENDGGVPRFTLNSLELAPTGGSAPTAAAIATEVWDRALAGHLDAGSTGEALSVAAAAGAAPTAVAIRQEMDANSTQFAALVGVIGATPFKTNNDGGLLFAGSYRKNVGGQKYGVYVTNAAGAPVTGANVQIKVSKDFGVGGNITGTVAQVDAISHPGWYGVEFSADDVNCNLCLYTAAPVGTSPRGGFYFTTGP